MDTMQAWYGLKEAHNDFSIENDTDANLFFARHELDKDLNSMLRRSFRTGTPPKLVLYGDWGVGKTHTMRHIAHVIASNSDFRGTVVFVELPDIGAKSTFQVAHAALLDALGHERASDWARKYYTKHPSDARERIKQFTQSGDVGTAFDSLISHGEARRIGWDWLRGVTLSASDARLVGLPAVLTQSTQLVRVLQMFGRLSLEIDETLLVFMLDEATKLINVSNNDAVNHWLNAFKVLADPLTKEVGLIVSISVVDRDDMALPLQDQQVVTRFGEGNYRRLHNLDERDAEVFVKALVAEWVDADKRKALIKQFEAKEADGEQVNEESFPFTAPGLKIAVQYACRLGGVTTPRDIQKALDDLLNRAMDDRRHVLSSSYVTSQVSA
jgi:hypothetical protein